MAAQELERRRLSELTEEVKQEIRRADESWRYAVGHAIRAGELLIEAKRLVKHGEWPPWLEASFSGSDRTARLYMRFASNRQQIADMPTVRDAVAMLTEPTQSAVTEQQEGALEDEYLHQLELLGVVGDRLIKAKEHMDSAEATVYRKPKQELLDKTEKYAGWAEELAKRLRALDYQDATTGGGDE
jgi:Protein of unknown function (DUF3102)